jgi:hypothetical protein
VRPAPASNLQSLHRPYSSIGYARRLGLFGSTSDYRGQRTGQASDGPTRNRTTKQIKRGLSLRNRLQSRLFGDGTATPLAGWGLRRVSHDFSGLARRPLFSAMCDIPANPRFHRNIGSIQTLSR